MVGFKNRYMVVEVNLNPNRDQLKDDPMTLTPYNVTKAIKDCILLNFGECGLASSVASFQVKYVNSITKVCIIRASRDEYQKVWSAITMMRSISNIPAVINLLDLSGSIKACKNAALKCEEWKFEQRKVVAGASLSAEVSRQMQGCLDKIKVLEH
ncbi:probable ribonuclease P/MRP protein subunit POP5 [Morus notabilis]|uniref:probable ribonuclease P/MRP protein subunit POP5 n=1 Tax=Morus notabilis TaxID=981085 RepID=UPI000CED4E91|nr:probable ribonuclease P/MRP protein subunit POP5 [Morus notabilis]